MVLFKYVREKESVEKLPVTSFTREGLKELVNLEEWVLKEPSLISPEGKNEILIVGKQKQSFSGKRLDLLGIDKFGNTIIIELKRDLANEMTEFQALSYASNIYSLSFEDLISLYLAHLEKYGKKLNLDFSEEEYNLEKVREKLEEFLSEMNHIEDFNRDQRIILVAGGFSDQLLSAVTWLIKKGIRIECIRLRLYKLNNELIIHPERVLPTKELADYFVQLKISEDRLYNAKKELKKSEWYWDLEKNLDQLKPEIAQRFRDIIIDDLINANVSIDRHSGTGFHLIYGDNKILVSTYNKNKVEFRFPKKSYEEMETLLKQLNVSRVKLKPKADIEAYKGSKHTPSIDCTLEDEFKEIKPVLFTILGVN